MTSISFNNEDVFSGLAPTPLVSLSLEPVRYDRRFVNKYLIKLNGTITGNFCNSFSEIKAKQEELISRFNKSIGPFKISTDISGEQVNFIADSAKVNSINFEAASYNSVLPFSIDLESYDNDFLATSGIISPERSISFKNSEDGTVNIDYKVSAKGLRSNDELGLNKAISYVRSLTGIENVTGFAPALIPASQHGLLLTSQSETFDRFNNTYSFDSSYTYDVNNTNSGNYSFLRYSVNVESGQEAGFLQCSVQGSLSKYIKNDPNLLLFDFQAISPYDLASNYFNTYFSGTLNEDPILFEVDLDNFNGVLNFNYTYDNNPQSLIIINPTVQISSERLSPISVSVDVNFKYRGNCLCNSEAGWNSLVSESLIYDYFGLAESKLTQFGFSESLNVNPVSESIATDKSACSISVSRAYSELKYDFADELDLFDFKVSIQPSVVKYATSPTIASGVWYIQNLGNRNRTLYSINGNAKIKDCVDINVGLEATQVEINQLAGQLIIGDDRVLESASFSQSEDNPRLVQFNFSWSAMGPQFII